MNEHDKLKLLAMRARAGAKTWWLWDEPRPEESGDILQFAHAASPEAVLALLADLQRLEEALGKAERALADAERLILGSGAHGWVGSAVLRDVRAALHREKPQ